MNACGAPLVNAMEVNYCVRLEGHKGACRPFLTNEDGSTERLSAEPSNAGSADA
jgi:hypothetical protein